jgi:hypothetical protein
LSCSTTVPDNPDTVPEIEYVPGGESVPGVECVLGVEPVVSPPIAGLLRREGRALTVKVLGMLRAALPALSAWRACAVYVPSPNGRVGATDQLPPEAVVVSSCIGKPEVLEPKNTSTVIADESRGAVLAVPENVGLLSFVVLPFSGLPNVTAGETVFTVHDARAGLGSSLPEGLIARTAKVCAPSTIPA